MIKRSILILAIFSAVLTPTAPLSAQELEVGSTYRFQGRLIPQEIISTNTPAAPGEPSTLNPLFIYLGSFEYGTPAVTYVKFQFVPYKKQELNTRWVRDETGFKFFSVPLTAITGRAERAYATGWEGSGEFVVGAVALPTKLRFDPFDFSGTVGLGPSVAWRWRASPTRDYYWGIIGSAGVSSVQLTPANTDGAIPEATDRAAYYLTVGAMAELRGYQLGLFVGWDFINAPYQKEWLHQGQPWVSLGIGAAIFGASRDGRSPGTQK